MPTYFKNFWQWFERKCLLRDDATELDLVCFRFFYSLVLAVRIFREIPAYQLKFEYSAYFIPHSFLSLFNLVTKPQFVVFEIVQFATIGVLILLAIGVKPRLMALIACALFTWSQLVYFAMHLVPATKYVFHSRNIIPFILLGLAIIPTARVKSLGDLASFATIKRSTALYSYIVTLICFSYTSALLTRFMISPLHWLTGEFIANNLAHYGFVSQIEWASKLALKPLATFFMSLGTSVLELFCWCLLIPGKHRLAFLIFGITFHVTIDLLNWANFVDWFGFSYLIFIPYTQIYKWTVSNFRMKAA